MEKREEEVIYMISTGGNLTCPIALAYGAFVDGGTTCC